MIEILTDDHYQTIMELFDRSDRTIKIISPFLTESMADRLCTTVKAKGVNCTFITRFYMDDMLNHVNSIEALEKMIKAGIDVYALEEVRNGRDESDAVFDMFREAEVMSEIKYPHTIWLKFDGEAHNRIAGNARFPMVKVALNGKAIYIQNYPRRPVSVKDGDEVYLAAITTDSSGKNQPTIMGRGKIMGFHPDSRAEQSWIPENPWMTRYPWYCVVKYCEVLNTTVNNGIPLDSILEKLRSNTYLVSFGRNEDIPTISKKHHQKAHIRLSGNAKEEIDRQFEKLKKKYGTLDYRSEI